MTTIQSSAPNNGSSQTLIGFFAPPGSFSTQLPPFTMAGCPSTAFQQYKEGWP